MRRRKMEWLLRLCSGTKKALSPLFSSGLSWEARITVLWDCQVLPIAVMGPNSTLMQSKWSVTGRLICWGCCLDEDCPRKWAPQWTPGCPPPSGLSCPACMHAYMHACKQSGSLKCIKKPINQVKMSDFFFSIPWINASRWRDGPVICL